MSIESPQSPPQSQSHINYVANNLNLSSPPLLCQKLTSFGRSNTQDRKLKQPSNFDSNKSSFNNPFYKSIERKTLTDDSDETLNYRLFSKKNVQQKLQQKQLLYHGSPQRNSLNFTMKQSDFHASSQRSMGNSVGFTKRPLSQDTILENTAHLAEFQQKMSSTPNSPDHYSCLVQSQASSPGLKLELENAKNKIFQLTNQLSKSNQLVSSLDQNLYLLKFELQKQTYTYQKREKAIVELTTYIDFIHKKHANVFEADNQSQFNHISKSLNQQQSSESLDSLNSMFTRRTTSGSSFLNDCLKPNNMPFSNEPCSNKDSFKSPLKSKPKSWLRSSFRKAFNRKNATEDLNTTEPSLNSIPSASISKCLSDVDENDMVNSSVSELIESNIYNHLNITESFSSQNSPLYFKQLTDDVGVQQEFHRILHQKESQLTDIRLEALATAHQLDSQKEENNRLRLEIEALKIENAKMQSFLSSQYSSSTSQCRKITPHQSICSSVSSASPSSSISPCSKLNLSLSTNHVDTSTSSILTPLSHKQTKSSTIVDSSDDFKQVRLSIYMGDTDPISDQKPSNQIFIGSLNITTRTNWDTLDVKVRHGFKNYLEKLENRNTPSLGLDVNSIMCYYVGEMPRIGSPKLPDLLPCGYLVGDLTNVVIQLKTASSGFSEDIDMLCFDTLVPKSRMLGYISLVLEHKNLLFCGPSGTCKSYLAKKLGEFLVRRIDGDIETSIVHLNVEEKSSKELKEFLNGICDQMGQFGDEEPLVLILDNLQEIGNNSDVFQDFFSDKMIKNRCSYVIGTINQSDVSSLNLHENFKWVLNANHTEPVNHYLNRYLQRRLIDFETKTASSKTLSNDCLKTIVEWMPRLWRHINKYIEQYNSNDLTLGPKIFAEVPFDYNKSMSWFIELWNNHIVPFMIEAIKEGVQVYGAKISWEDPKSWVISTFPWVTGDNSVLNKLHSIEAQCVGFDSDTESSGKVSSSNEDDSEKDKDFDDMDYLANLNLKSGIEDNGKQFSNDDSDKLLSILIRLQECTSGQPQNRPVSCLSRRGYSKNIDLNSIDLNESTI